MPIPKRIKRTEKRHALVDGIPYVMPVSGRNSPVLMAVYSIDADKARALLPGNQLHPVRLWNRKRALLVVTVIDYRDTSIGKYIEFSIAIACTHGPKPAPPLLPGLFMKHYGTGQYVVDLPVSSEISVKGGKGIWGMPNHQANLDFVISDRSVSSQYDLDGQLAVRIDIPRPAKTFIPLGTGAANYCSFRGLLMKSYIYFGGKMGFSLRPKGRAMLTVGPHPRVRFLKDLNISRDPLVTLFFPGVSGVLDDYFESWFLTYDSAPLQRPEGIESVVDLGLSQEWLDPPNRGQSGNQVLPSKAAPDPEPVAQPS
jgi:hypothetical protein